MARDYEEASVLIMQAGPVSLGIFRVVCVVLLKDANTLSLL